MLLSYSPSKILKKASPTTVNTFLLCGSLPSYFLFSVLSSKACGVGWELGGKGKMMSVFVVVHGILVDWC